MISWKQRTKFFEEVASSLPIDDPFYGALNESIIYYIGEAGLEGELLPEHLAKLNTLAKVLENAFKANDTSKLVISDSSQLVHIYRGPGGYLVRAALTDKDGEQQVHIPQYSLYITADLAACTLADFDGKRLEKKALTDWGWVMAEKLFLETLYYGLKEVDRLQRQDYEAFVFGHTCALKLPTTRMAKG